MNQYLTAIPVHLASASSIITNSAGTACGSVCGNASATVLIGHITNALIYLVGAVAVIMIIVGGLLYVTSSGDPSRQKRARETITYAVVGVVVAIISFAIVNFVIKMVR